LASAQDERILNERRRHLDRAFDATPVYGCPLDELDRLTFEREFLPQAIAPDVLAANDRSYEDRLASLGHDRVGGRPDAHGRRHSHTGKSPRTWVPCAYIQFLRIRGTELADPIADAAELDGTLQQMLRRADEKLAAFLTTEVDFTSATIEERRTPYR
jgi:ATP-dependent DNA helicase RecG